MLAHIKKTIAELKSKIKHNVELINNNQDTIKRLINQSDIQEFDHQYEAYNKQNKALLAQNNDFINVQLTLINFLEKYKDTAILHNEIPVIDIYSITDSQEVFALTIRGIIPFNEKHPSYQDPSFIDKLIVYYKSKEDYERCKELIELKENTLS